MTAHHISWLVVYVATMVESHVAASGIVFVTTVIKAQTFEKTTTDKTT